MKTSMHNASLIYSNAEHDRRLLLLELTYALGGSRRSLISAFMSPSHCTQNVPPPLASGQTGQLYDFLLRLAPYVR